MGEIYQESIVTREEIEKLTKTTGRVKTGNGKVNPTYAMKAYNGLEI